MQSERKISPVPDGVVAYITGANENMYALFKDGELIVIQAPSKLAAESSLDADEEFSLAKAAEYERIFFDDLEQLRTVVHTIEFGKTNWGYLVHHPRRGYEILQKQRRMPKLTCHTWARLIPFNEVHFTRFWPGLDIWNGYWKEREVDVFMAYNDRTMRILDQEMRGYLALQGLDLTYEVLGHVVNNDGTIVGLAYEAHVGRLLQFRDRALVYDALSKVQQRGLVFCGAQEFTNIHIMNGKVRLTNLASIWHFPDEKLRKEHGDERHWKPLESWFPALKAQKDNTPRPVYQRLWDHNVQLLPHISPDRPLFAWFTLDLPSIEVCAKRNEEVLSWLRRHATSRNHLALPGRSSSSARDPAFGWHVAGRSKGSRRRRDQKAGEAVPGCRQILISSLAGTICSESEPEPVYMRGSAVKVLPRLPAGKERLDSVDNNSPEETETMTGSTYYSRSSTLSGALSP
ncbi:hypothetical protein LshimejAT787_1701520 [Lyophyllum shimeji]|uniref:Uncharacterized protein n=1 Tax=Lyophyllum shimeji TaxID=47721 RepID=A0A9P3PYU8_LYOSH|nr:hypothetical protein LshimejAT787_1701520 [Lyophyllum shimeji]